MTVAKIQNNEFPGFYSAVAQINHPVWAAQGVANLIRRYAEEDRNAVGSFVVFNETQKVYERIIVKSKTVDDSCTLTAFRPNSHPLQQEQTMLGQVYFNFKEFSYGRELPNGDRKTCLRIFVRDLDSKARHLRGLGTQLIQAALEFYPASEGRMMLHSDHYPHPHPFYYELGMRWADRPYLMSDKTPDYDAIILKEIEDARKEGRKASTTHMQNVPRALLLYFPDDAIKVWQEIINKRPVLYPRHVNHNKPAKQ